MSDRTIRHVRAAARLSLLTLVVALAAWMIGKAPAPWLPWVSELGDPCMAAGLVFGVGLAFGGALLVYPLLGRYRASAPVERVLGLVGVFQIAVAVTPLPASPTLHAWVATAYFGACFGAIALATHAGYGRRAGIAALAGIVLHSFVLSCADPEAGPIATLRIQGPAAPGVVAARATEIVAIVLVLIWGMAVRASGPSRVRVVRGG